MSRHVTNITLLHDHPTSIRGRRGKDMLRAAINKATSVLAGVEPGTSCIVTASLGGATSPPALLTGVAPACTAGISSGASGTVGIIINGTTITVSHGASDTIDAGAIAAAINASTSSRVQFLVGSTNLKSTLTLASVTAGTEILIAGFRFTAVAGTTESYKDGVFTIGGTDTQDGTSLCAAINRHSSASRFLFALNVAGACHVFPKSAAWFTGPDAPPNNVQCGAATVTVGSATFAASTYYGVYAKVVGQIGNCFTVAASGTGQSIENTNTRLTRGLGPSAEPVWDNL